MRLEIRLRNSLPVSYGKPVALDLKDLTVALKMARKWLKLSEGIRLDSNGLLLDSVSEGTEYFASIGLRTRFAVFKSEREETLYANLGQAEKTGGELPSKRRRLAFNFP